MSDSGELSEKDGHVVAKIRRSDFGKRGNFLKTFGKQKIGTFVEIAMRSSVS